MEKYDTKDISTMVKAKCDFLRARIQFYAQVNGLTFVEAVRQLENINSQGKITITDEIDLIAPANLHSNKTP